MPKPPSGGALTPKEQAFVREYLIDLNASAALLRAGYRSKNPDVDATDLRRRPRVAKAIAEAMKARAERLEIKADDILRRLHEKASVDPARAYDPQGKLLLIHDIPPEVRSCIKSIETFEEFENVGGERVQVGVVRKITWWDKLKSDELLGKHLKMWTDTIELKDGEGRAERLARARARVKKGDK